MNAKWKKADSLGQVKHQRPSQLSVKPMGEPASGMQYFSNSLHSVVLLNLLGIG